MKRETERWLNEGRVRIDEVSHTFTRVASMSSHGAEGLFTPVEYAMKAPIVEHFGSFPSQFKGHDVVILAQRTGLWALVH